MERSNNGFDMASFAAGLLAIGSVIIAFMLKREILIYMAILTAAVGFILSIVSFTKKGYHKIYLPIGFILNFSFLILVLILYFYFAYADAQEFSRGDA